MRNKIRNLTPYDLHFIINGEMVTVDREDVPTPRVVEELQYISNVPISEYTRLSVVKVSYGEVVDLPEEEDYTVLVVSRMIAEALPERKDLYFPIGATAIGYLGQR